MATNVPNVPNPQTHKTPPSWMLTFADLLGIILALFVLIYATSDRRADFLQNAFIDLKSPFSAAQRVPDKVTLADVASASGYQVALLKKYVHAMPYWSVDDADEDTLYIRLYGQPLSDALGDGSWLDIIERFGRDVTLRVYVSDEKQRAAAHAGAQHVAEMRATRGLSLPWTVSIEASRDASIQAEIAIAKAQEGGTLRYAGASDAEKAAL